MFIKPFLDKKMSIFKECGVFKYWYLLQVLICMSTPTKGGWWGGTFSFWDGSCRCRHKTSCPLCNLNTLWNILMILGRSGQDDMSHTRLTTLAFLLLGISPFVLFEKDFVSI